MQGPHGNICENWKGSAYHIREKPAMTTGLSSSGQPPDHVPSMKRAVGGGLCDEQQEPEQSSAS